MSPNVAASQITKTERWNKLYRIIHHLFLRNEFIHKDDYLQMVKEMNARFATLEAMVVAELGKVQIGLSTHVHPSPPAPVNPVVTGPPGPLPPYTSAAKVGTIITPIVTNMYNEDLRLLGLGPAKAPLSIGVSSDELTSNADSITTVGF